jgi:multidrug efflux pump subunit AcrA (membrane-fusion protein)
VKAGAPAVPPALNGINAGRVWIMEGKKLVPHDIRLGATDGHASQVLTGDLKAGEDVVTDFAKAPGQP